MRAYSVARYHWPDGSSAPSLQSIGTETRACAPNMAAARRRRGSPAGACREAAGAGQRVGEGEFLDGAPANKHYFAFC